MTNRFLQFTDAISHIQRMIQKLKSDGMRTFSLKGAHVLCLSRLWEQQEPISFALLVQRCGLDAGLMSRTLKELVADGKVDKTGDPGKYFCRYRLTAEGAAIAAEIDAAATAVQTFVDTGVTEEELEVFYRVLKTLESNFETLMRERTQLLPQYYTGE